MSLKIRLARAGSKKRPYYHIVIADVRSPRDGRFIERVGAWNPTLPKDAERVTLVNERIEYWLGHGAQPTDRVLRFLDQAGLVKRPARANPIKGELGKKAQERLAAEKQAAEDKIAAAKQAAEDAKQAAIDAKAAAEAAAAAPAEEAATEETQA